MIRAEVPISVPEGDDPLLRILVSVVALNGSRTPYDFTDADSVEFLVKAGTATPDEDADAVYEGEVLDPPTDGRVDVQVLGADVGSGVRRYKLVVTKNQKRETVMAGQFIIQDL